MITLNSYDIDGVIFMGAQHEGLRPGPDDIIVTGRSYQQKDETLSMLRGRGINNFVFFNPLSRTDVLYGRLSSGEHKAKTLKHLYEIGVCVVYHFEDDPIQADEVRKIMPNKSKVVMIGNREHIETDDDLSYNVNEVPF